MVTTQQAAEGAAGPTDRRHPAGLRIPLLRRTLQPGVPPVPHPELEGPPQEPQHTQHQRPQRRRDARRHHRNLRVGPSGIPGKHILIHARFLNTKDVIF